jgi:hypothetical protein
MAWILVSGKPKTEPVEDGEVVERMCGACGQDADFAEHRGPRGQQMMMCGACGALFRTSEVSTVDTAVESAMPVLERAKEALGAASEGLGPLAKKAGETFERIKESFSFDDDDEPTVSEPLMSDDEPTISDDDPIKADLLRRFAELEKRQKK